MQTDLIESYPNDYNPEHRVDCWRASIPDVLGVIVGRSQENWDCAQVVVRLYHFIDRRQFRKAADLFTDKATFLRMGTELVGREAIFEALDEPDTGRIARHLVHNLVVDRPDDKSAIVRHDLTTYAYTPSDPDTSPPAVPAPRAIMDCIDRLVLEDDGWKVDDKRYEVIFRNS